MYQAQAYRHTPEQLSAETKLVKYDAYLHFKQQIQQLNSQGSFPDQPHPVLWLSWVVEGISYDVSITTHSRWLRWTMHFTSDRKYKNGEKSFTDYKYYIIFIVITADNANKLFLPAFLGLMPGNFVEETDT